MTISPMTVAGPIFLTMLLGVSFLASGFEKLRFKLPVFVFLVSLVWVDSFFRTNHQRAGLEWFMTHPAPNAFPWPRAAVAVIGLILWGLVLYWLVTTE